jgi:DNA-binding beta-propeller fold protein YncE/cytochrome c peroxidase
MEVLWLVVGAALATALIAPGGVSAATYRSPYDAAFSPDGKLIAVSDYTAASVTILDGAGKKVLRQVDLKGQPAGLAWAPKGNVLYVAELGAGTVAEVDAATGKIARRLAAGPRVAAVALAPKQKLLVAANSGLHSVSIVDLASGKEKARIPVIYEPRAIAVSPDESVALIANLLPKGNATEATQSVAISVIDLKGLKKAKDIKLPSGCTLTRDVVISPDGKWAYASHTLGRFTLPTTQLDRGWVNTNAMSVIDLQKQEHYATVLLDRLTEGAADPWGLAIAADGKTLWVTLSGVHQLGKLDLESLHLLMEGKDIPKDKPTPDGTPRHLSAIWGEIKKDQTKRDLLANDLAALYGAGLLIRTRLNCKVLLAEADTGKVIANTPLGKQPKMDMVRRGELIFHDATYCFQHWLSCSTCHPEGRADALNWDLLNDGIGNPKNTKNLLWTNRTPPVMSRGVRANFGVAALAGFRFILFREPESDEVEAVKAFFKSLEPAKSPHLTADGNLTAQAVKGKAIFEDPKTGCATCHPAPLYTDLKIYNVGTRGELDRVDAFDTPTLVELWRSAPFLHDGAAKDLREILTTSNKGDKHGKTSHLTKQQMDQLIAYLLSL